jgi:hypothetical protein
MGAAFILYAQGLLPFLLPLSVLLFEPDSKSRRRMRRFLLIGTGTTLYVFVGIDGIPIPGLYQEPQHRVLQSSNKQHTSRSVVRDFNMWLALFFEGQGYGDLRRGEPCNSAGCDGGKGVRVHLGLVCLCGCR